MASEDSEMPDSSNGVSKHLHVERLLRTDYPDYPKRTDDMSKEDYVEAVKDYFKLKGLKHFQDFSEDEKKAIVEDNTIHLIGPKALCEKYKTMPFVVTSSVRAAGLSVTPDDLSAYPDFPKRTVSQTDEEFQVE